MYGDPRSTGETKAGTPDGTPRSAATVAELKGGEGGPIMVNGSATLVQTLYRHGLVDEYRLMVFPVVLGSGKRLFPDDAPDKQKLELASSRTFDNGVQLQVLRPVR